MNHDKIYEAVNSGHRREVMEDLTNGVGSGEIGLDEFSIAGLAEALIQTHDGSSCGREWMRKLNPKSAGGFSNVLEASDAVDTADFANITGQIVFSKVREAFSNEQFTLSGIVDTVQTSFNGEKIPGIGMPGEDEIEAIGEGDVYPNIGLQEDWIETPSTVKRGGIIPITREAIFFDRTNLVLQKASQIGTVLGTNKEKRIADAISDENVTTHRIVWRGTSYATYATSGGHGSVNKKTSNGLVDFDNVDAAEQIFAGMTDVTSGDPVTVLANTIICAPDIRAAAMRISGITASIVFDGGSSADQKRQDSRTSGLMNANYNVVSSRMLKARMTTDTTWFLCDPKRAWAYMQNWPLQVSQASQNDEVSFTRDIVVRYKATERGAAATMDFQATVQNVA